MTIRFPWWVIGFLTIVMVSSVLLAEEILPLWAMVPVLVMMFLWLPVTLRMIKKRRFG
jgi:hypothetical protein